MYIHSIGMPTLNLVSVGPSSSLFTVWILPVHPLAAVGCTQASMTPDTSNSLLPGPC